MFDDEITKTLQIKADFVVSFEHSRAALCAGNLLNMATMKIEIQGWRALSANR